MMIFILVGYLAYRVAIIYTTHEYDYVKRDSTYTEEEMNSMNYTLGDFESSYSLIFGFNHYEPNFDTLNNPYVQVISFEAGLNDMDQIKYAQTDRVVNCDPSYLERFLEAHVIPYFSQPLCIRDMHDTIIKNNINMKTFQYPVITVSHCFNTT